MSIRGVGVALAALALSGCINVSVNESSVFAPVPFDADLAARTGEKLKDEGAFASAAAWDAAWKARAAGGWLTLPAPAFEPTKVEHGQVITPSGPLAWTKLTRAGEDRPFIVRCGGNASTRQNNAFVYGGTAIQHGDVLLFDYPGSGETGGKASSASFEGMGEALAEKVRVEAQGRKLVLWGHSLGGFVCADLARRLPETDGVIFEASARNAARVADAWKPWFLGPLVRVNIAEGLGGYDNALALKERDVPVLVLGGRKDRTLPVKLARDLARTLEKQGARVDYVEFPQGVHSDFPGQSNFPQVIDAYFKALK